MTSALLDTSVVIDWHDPDVIAVLPDEMAISAITAAELAAGPHLAPARWKPRSGSLGFRKSNRRWNLSSSTEPLHVATDSSSPPSSRTEDAPDQIRRPADRCDGTRESARSLHPKRRRLHWVGKTRPRHRHLTRQSRPVGQSPQPAYLGSRVLQRTKGIRATRRRCRAERLRIAVNHPDTEPETAAADMIGQAPVGDIGLPALIGQFGL